MTGMTCARLALFSCVGWLAGCPSPTDATDDTGATESEGTEAESGADGSSGGSSTTGPGEATTGSGTSSGGTDTTAATGDSSTSTSSGTDAGTLTLGDSSGSGGQVGNGTPFEEACQQWCEPIFECGFFTSEPACLFACEYSLVVHAEWSDECVQAEQDEWDCIANQDACDPSQCSIDASVEACAPHVGTAAEDYCMRRQECGLDTAEDLESCTYGAGSFFDGLLAFEPCPAAQDAYLDCLTAVSCDVLDERAMGVGSLCADAYGDGVDICLDAAGLL